MDALKQCLSAGEEEMAHMWLNVLLVGIQGRRATLLETANVFHHPQKTAFFQHIQTYIQTHGLVAQVWDPKPLRILVTREEVKRPADPEAADEVLARQLGFFCVGHDFGNADVIRYTLEVKAVTPEEQTISVVTEICEARRVSKADLAIYGQRWVDQLNAVWHQAYQDQLPLTFVSVVTEQTPQRLRLQKLRSQDRAFVQAHLDEYLDDLYNYWSDQSFELAMQFEQWANGLASELTEEVVNFVFTVFVQEHQHWKLFSAWDGFQRNEFMSRWDAWLGKHHQWSKLPHMWTLIRRRYNRSPPSTVAVFWDSLIKK